MRRKWHPLQSKADVAPEIECMNKILPFGFTRAKVGIV
jgi:hypothetical protein